MGIDPVIEAILAMVAVVGLIVASLFLMHVLREVYCNSLKCLAEKIKKIFK